MGQNTLASTKQTKYIEDLIVQRTTWPTIPERKIRNTIRYVKRGEDVGTQDASKAIDALLKLPVTQPKITNEWTKVNDILQSLPLSRYALPRVDGSGWDFF